MKKQAFKGKLSLNKSVVSNLTASMVQGGGPTGLCQTLIGHYTCGVNCNLTQDPGCVSGTPDCHTIHIQTDCACL